MRTHAEFGIHLLGDAQGEIGSGDLVDGNDNSAAQQASEERHYPLGAVLAPDENLVVLADAAGFELTRKTIGTCEHVAVSPALHPIAAMVDVSHFPRVAPKVVEILQDGGACHLSTV